MVEDELVVELEDESEPDDVLVVEEVADEDDESEPADELELEPPRLSVL